MSEIPKLAPAPRPVPAPRARIGAPPRRATLDTVARATFPAAALRTEASVNAIRRALTHRRALQPLDEEAPTRGAAAAWGAGQPA